MFRLVFLSIPLLVGLIFPASAHEYYLMPESFTPAAGKEFGIRHRLGQKFKGNELPYIEKWNIRSEVWNETQNTEVRGKDGDRPALKITAAKPGLMRAIHQSNIDLLTFSTWEKFVTYTDKEGLSHAQSASLNGTKPKEGLIEAYARYAKTLIAIDGSTEGKDAATGLKIEIIAQRHPLELKTDEPMPVQVLYDGKPLSGARMKIFVGVDTEFAHQILTDANGLVEVPAKGKGPYLLNVIKMTEPQSDEAKEKKAHWESFWASLTFERAR